MIDTSHAALMAEERVKWDVEVLRYSQELRNIYPRSKDDVCQFMLKTQEQSFEGGAYPDPLNFVIDFLRGGRGRKDRYPFEGPASIGNPLLRIRPEFTVYLEGDMSFVARVTAHVESVVSAEASLSPQRLTAGTACV